MRFAHEDGQGGTSKVSVQLELDNEKRIVPINTDKIVLTREFDTTTGKDVFMLDNKVILKNDVYSLFGLSGISFNEICRTIHQGKISEIANLDEAGILELLFDYSGATQLKERLENLRKCLDLCDDKKESIDKFKITVEEKLQYISSKVSDFEKLQKLTTEKYSLEFLKLKKLGDNLHGELESNEDERKKLILELNDAKLKKTNYLRSHEESITKIKELESNIHALKDKKRMYKDFVEMNLFHENKAMNDDQNMRFIKDEYERNAEDLDKPIDQLKKELEHNSKDKKKAISEIEKLTAQVNEVQSEYIQYKQQYDNINDQLNNDAVKKTGFKSDKDRKDYYREEIDKMVTEITILERDLDIETQTKDKNEKYEGSLKSQLNGLKSDLDEKKREEFKVKKELDPSKKRQDNMHQIQKMNFRLNEKKIERDENQRKMARVEEIIESADKKFKTIKRLVKKIDEADITGYHGLFVDLIEVNDRIEFSVDIALKNKMFVIVVDTVAAAQKVINLNKSIKGGVVSCFALELIDQINDRLPDLPSSGEIQSILNFVKLKSGVDERVQKLLHNFLGRTVLVRNLSTAFGVSEKYNVTSITAEMKVVSPGAFIAKTGY